MNKYIQITYKTKTDQYGIEVKYYIKIWQEEKVVWWGFHPILPKGMHWKKGDETGIGFDHHDSTQRFEEFASNPTHEMPNELFRKALRIVEA